MFVIPIFPSIRRNLSAIKAIFFLWGSTLVGAGLAFLAQIVLGRTLGTEQFGLFSSALALVVLLVPLAGLGVSQLWLKLFGEEGWEAVRWLPASFRLLLLSSGLAMLLLLMWIFLLPHDAVMRWLYLLLLLHLPAQVVIELVASRYQLEENYRTLALWQFWPHASRLLILLLLLFTIFWQAGFNGIQQNESSLIGVYSVACTYAFVAMFFLLWGGLRLRAMFRGDFRLQGHSLPQVEQNIGGAQKANSSFPSLIQTLRLTWPYGLGGMLYLLYFQSGVIVVHSTLGAEAAGLYNAAFVIMAAIYLFPSVIYQKYLLPKIHRWAAQSSQALHGYYRQGNRLMLIFGIAAGLIVAMMAPWVLPLLFGASYANAAEVLIILAIAAPFRFVASSVGVLLVTGDHMRRKVFCMALVALVYLLLSVILLKVLGLKGVAIAAVISDGLLLFLYTWAVNRYVFIKKTD